MRAVRTCCVWCPDWPVTAARRREPGLRGVPVAIRERDGGRDVVRAASAEARVAGVTRGIRRREAEARCPGLAFVDADPAFEARAFEVVARAIEALTPRVVLERPGLCAFPTRGPSRYFGGDDALAAHVLAAIARAIDDGSTHSGGDRVRVGIADGAFAARLAARAADPDAARVVPPGESAAFVGPWPVDVLADADLASLLVRLGLRTLGDVAALPDGAVLARFGAHGARIHALARGLDDGPPVLVSPPPDLVEQAELDPPAARVDVAAFAAKGLAGRLLERLAARGLACTRIVIEAETEHGERLSRCWRHDGALTPATLAERVRWQLDGWLAAHDQSDARAVEGDVRAQQDQHALADAGLDTTTGALTLVRLVPDEVVPADGRQLGFWGGDQAARDRADRALARVQGMLGYESVVTAVPQGGRTPSERVRWVPWGEPREPQRPLAVHGERPGWPGALPTPSPARVFDPPLPAALFDATGMQVTVSGRGEASAVPVSLHCSALAGGGGRVHAWAGPWAHDVRWWDPDEHCRRALWQVLVDTTEGARSGGEGSYVEVACLVVLEAGRCAIEAIYD